MTRLNLALAIPLILFVAFIAAFFWGMMRDDPESLPTVFIDKPAPPLPTDRLANLLPAHQEMLLEPGLKLVNFWASWCPPCRAEHPNLLKLQQEGWTIIGVNKSDEEANAMAFLNELENPYSAVVADPSGRGSIEWGVYGLPETFLIDENGNIRYRHPGPVTNRVWNDRFAPLIRALLAEKG